MKHREFVFVLLLPLALPGAALGQLETQSFDSAQSASAAGWVGVGNQENNWDFGFSDSNNAEGAGSGEAGGLVLRGAGYPYYADVSVGILHLGRDLQAMGRIKYQNTNFDGQLRLGWFNTGESNSGEANLLGINVAEPNSATNGAWRNWAFQGGNGDPQMNVPNDLAINFTIDWDADGGAGGNAGLLTVSFNSVDGTYSASGTREASADPAVQYNAFGLLGWDAPTPSNQTGNFWMDDLVYSGEGESFPEGDADRDRDVDLDDFRLILDNLFDTVPTREQGDVNFDGIVDFKDFRIWKNVFQAAGGGVAAVPEPASLGLALIAMALAFLARQRRMW